MDHTFQHTVYLANGVSTEAGAADVDSVIHIESIISPDFQWAGSQWSSSSFDIERNLNLNQLMRFERGQSAVQSCIIVSQGNEHIACVMADPTICRLDIAVYRTARDSMVKAWTSQIPLSSQQGSRDAQISGFVSADGKRMLIKYNSDSLDGAPHYVTSNQGEQWTILNLRRECSFSEIIVCDDERIFITGSASSFGRGGQGQFVDTYSTQLWEFTRSWTFSFGDGCQWQNFSVISNLPVGQPIFCLISTHSSDSFRKEEPNRYLMCSSAGKQFYIQGIDSPQNGVNKTWISGDGCHMVHRPDRDAQIMHWRLTHPTLIPTATPLPDVEVAPKQVFRIFGKDTVVSTHIPKQVTFCRFSPGSKVVTVVVANDCRVVISSFLLPTFQLVYKKIVQCEMPNGYVALKIHADRSRGVSVIGGLPATGSPGTNPYGLLLSFWQVPGAIEAIVSVEKYFDTIDAAIQKVSSGPKNNNNIIQRWSLSEDNAKRVLGDGASLTDMETGVQKYVYNLVFSRHLDTTSRNMDARVIHVLTISYPWDTESRIAVFIILMRYSYVIIAATPTVGCTSQAPSQAPYCIRALYVSDNLHLKTSDNVEVTRDGLQYILCVTRPQSSMSQAYSGMRMPIARTTNVGHHFLPNDAEHDVFLVKESISATTVGNWNSAPNVALLMTSNFIAYLWPHSVLSIPDNDRLNFGSRNDSRYNMSKILMGLEYKHKSHSGLFGSTELDEYIGECYNTVYEDRTYDTTQPLFPSPFAAASFIDYLSNSTTLVDEFLRRYHLSEELVSLNSRAISCSLPAACRARPIGVLSFMRHISLSSFYMNQIRPVEVSSRSRITKGKKNKQYLRQGSSQANDFSVTIPLEGFCSYETCIHQVPTKYFHIYRDNLLTTFFSLAEHVFFSDVMKGVSRVTQVPDYRWIKRPTSPFSCLVVEVFHLDDVELQFSILNVIWFQRLISWKMETFGRSIYIIRYILPFLVNSGLHFALGVLTTATHQYNTPQLVLAGLQALVCTYLITQKVRQVLNTWLFFRSGFNYVDILAILLSLAMSIQVVAGRRPPRAFVAYSMPVLWVDLLLMTRIFEQTGIMMMLLTEMIKGITPFLGLLALFMLGFSFIPYFLLHTEPGDLADNPFRDFGRTFGEMITFMSNDFTSLEPWNDSLVSIRILRPVFTVIVSVLLLNALIALLNLKVEEADSRSKNIWTRQMAIMIVEIEWGLLTDKERQDCYWFPCWFSYTISEAEKRDWVAFLERNQLKLGYDTPPAPPNTTTARPVGNTHTSQSQVSPPANQSSPQPQSQVSGQDPMAKASTPVEAPQTEAVQGYSVEPEHDVSTSSSLSTVQPSAKSSTSTIASQVKASNIEYGPDIPSSSSSSSIQSSPIVTLTETNSASGPAEASPPKCGLPGCTETGPKVCTGCKNARYCSAEHQLADWKVHRRECKGKSKSIEIGDAVGQGVSRLKVPHLG